jgi:hypothetical protein
MKSSKGWMVSFGVTLPAGASVEPQFSLPTYSDLGSCSGQGMQQMEHGMYSNVQVMLQLG